MSRFDIDFFEFAFLVESCIPPKPIARSVFWDKVINYYYHVLTQKERDKLFEWINLNQYFKNGLEKKDMQCLMFYARYDPNNQYIVTIKYQNKKLDKEIFKFNDRYHININTTIEPKYIINVRKKSNELSGRGRPL